MASGLKFGHFTQQQFKKFFPLKNYQDNKKHLKVCLARPKDSIEDNAVSQGKEFLQGNGKVWIAASKCNTR